MKAGSVSITRWLLMLGLVLTWSRIDAQEQAPLSVTQGKITCRFWMESSLKRVYPRSPVGTSSTLTIPAARNQRVSFQICLNNASLMPLDAVCEVSDPKDLKVRVRRVGYVPLEHLTPSTSLGELEGRDWLPGLVPDPLYPTLQTRVGPAENLSYWVTVSIPGDVAPGPHEPTFRINLPGLKKRAEMKVRIEVFPLTVKPRHDFAVTHWWGAADLYEWYHVEPWSDAWFKLAEAYIRDLVDHGSDTLLIPTLFFRRELYRQPGQMLIVKRIQGESGDRYEFDFRHVKRLIDLARRCGIVNYEFPHLWIYWGVKHPMPVYQKVGDRYEPLWALDADGFGDAYRSFLTQYLAALHDFLQQEKILDRSIFHLSDELGSKDIANYRRARALLKEIAPWMKVMDALSDFEYGRSGVCDMPVPQVSRAKPYIDAKLPHWVYYCCSPKGAYLNRFMDTPLVKIRMSGWLFYRLGARGFLHWGYNYWHKLEKDEMLDPFVQGDAADYPGIPYGDPFEVYPGPEGPIDSIRWEIFAESLQDYALLQTVGLSPDDPLLAPIHDYANFPKSEQWLKDAMSKILARGATR